jgi:hypothetical protein
MKMGGLPILPLTMLLTILLVLPLAKRADVEDAVQGMVRKKGFIVTLGEGKDGTEQPEVLLEWVEVTAVS